MPLTVTGSQGQQFVVPAGHLVFTSPAVSMNLPDGSEDCVFKVRNSARFSAFLLFLWFLNFCSLLIDYEQNSAMFDPDRFLRNEDKAKPFAYSAFGGGMHGCLGEQFGFLQVRRRTPQSLAIQ